MVDVPVGQEDGHRAQPVLPEHVVQRLLDPDPRVDHEALLAVCRSQDIAVGVERLRRKAHDEHASSCSSDGPAWAAPRHYRPDL